MDTVQLIEISSRECKQYLMEGGDLALLPVGATERLGPHLPLNSKNDVVYAVSEALARRNKGYCLPVIPYATVYDTDMQMGSVDIHPQVLYDYIYDICKELTANGFRRIIIVSYFEELYYVIQEFFQKEDIVIAWVCPDRIPIPAAKDSDTRETSLIAACLKLRGKDAVLNRLLEENQKRYGKYSSLKAEQSPLKDLKKLGKVGYHYRNGEYAVLPCAKVYLDETIAAINDWAESKVSAVEAMKEYNDYLSRSQLRRGLR